MNSINRISESDKKQLDLETMCQCLVWTPEDLKELQRILRNAPVTLSQGITDFECHLPAHLAYLFDNDDLNINTYCSEIDDYGIEGVKLSERRFHRCVEILVDPTETIDRDYEQAIESGWDIGNYKGQSVLTRDQLELRPHLAKTLEIYSNKPAGQVVVVYNRGEEDYLISLKLFDRERFHYPRTASVKHEDSNGEIK
jgi:hypothetical protein